MRFLSPYFYQGNSYSLFRDTGRGTFLSLFRLPSGDLNKVGATKGDKNNVQRM